MHVILCRDTCTRPCTRSTRVVGKLAIDLPQSRGTSAPPWPSWGHPRSQHRCRQSSCLRRGLGSGKARLAMDGGKLRGLDQRPKGAWSCYSTCVCKKRVAANVKVPGEGAGLKSKFFASGWVPSCVCRPPLRSPGAQRFRVAEALFLNAGTLAPNIRAKPCSSYQASIALARATASIDRANPT